MNPVGVANSNAGTDHSDALRSLIVDGGDVESDDKSWMEIFNSAHQEDHYPDPFADPFVDPFVPAGLDQVC